MPPAIAALERSQGGGGGGAGAIVGGSVDVSGGSASGLVVGGVAGGVISGYTQLRVEIERLDFTNPTDAKAIETLVRRLKRLRPGWLPLPFSNGALAHHFCNLFDVLWCPLFDLATIVTR